MDRLEVELKSAKEQISSKFAFTVTLTSFTVTLTSFTVSLTSFIVTLPSLIVTLTYFTITLICFPVTLTSFTTTLTCFTVIMTPFTVTLIPFTVILSSFTATLTYFNVTLTYSTVTLTSFTVTLTSFTVTLTLTFLTVPGLRNERKKLRGDKNDLLAHVKQLCSSLQDKEQELRDFIRNFEQRIRDSETNAAKLSTDRERERWSLLKHARDEAERSLTLAAQLNARDIQLQRTQEQLQEARRQLSGCMSDQESLISLPPLTPPSGLHGHLGPSGQYSNLGGQAGDRGSCSADSGVRGSSDRESAADLNLSDGTCENGPCITVDADSISLVSSHHMYQCQYSVTFKSLQNFIIFVFQ